MSGNYSRGLNFSRGDGGLLVIRSQLAGFSGDALENVCYLLATRQMLGSQRTGIPLTKEFRIDMARLEIPVSGWTCLRTARMLGLGHKSTDTDQSKQRHVGGDEVSPQNIPL